MIAADESVFEAFTGTVERMVPPIVLDIDGTLTLPDSDRSPPPIDPRMFDRLRTWSAPVVLATGKAFPMPVALCQFIGIPVRVVAETGAIAYTETRLEVFVDTRRHEAVLDRMRDRGHVDAHPADLINRWRESEIALRRDVPLDELESIARDVGLEVVDTGYAYHVKDPSTSKGEALQQLLGWESIDPVECVAIGDSANDVSMFDRVGRSYAVGNADPAAKRAADVILDKEHADATLAVLDRLD